MRNPLNKRLPREFKKNASKYIGIFLILACTIIVGSAFLVSIDSVTYTMNKVDKECKTEDGQFETLSLLSEETKEYFEENDILLAPNFYSTVNDYEETAKILIFDEREVLNLPAIFEGELPDNQNEIAIDRLFASNRNISIGDKITLHDKDFTVTATIALPDYNSLFKSNQDLLMNTTDFGVSVVTKEGFERFDEDTLTYRYSYYFKDRDLSDSKKRENDEAILEHLLTNQVPLQSFLTAKNNQSITFLKEDMGKDGPVMKAFIYILIVVIAFVFAVLTNNTIEAEAPIIGTLRASGYLKREIVAHYISPTLIIAIIGSVVGNLLGYTIMLKPFADIYYSTYSIPPIELRFHLEAFITTTILPVVIMIVVNWCMLYNKLSLSPLKFLRKDLSKKKQKKAVKLPEFSFMKRFHLRVLLQNKVSYLILFFGIFLSSFLLMFGIGMEPLMDHYTQSIDDSLPYEYQYILKAPIELDGGEKLETYTLSTWYELGKMDMSVSFMGVNENSDFYDNIPLPAGKDEITISEPLAKKMNLEIGDVLTFKDDYEEKEYSLKVANICDYSGSLSAFMTRENLNCLLENEPDAFNCYISNEKLSIDEAYLAKYITRSDMIGATKQMLISFDMVFKFLNIFSVVIYMVLMYILTKTVIEKNALSISFMKVFGYDSKEINRLYLNATTITVLCSLFICIPLEALCFKYILVYIAAYIEGYIEFYLPFWVYAAIIVIGIVAYFVINARHVYKVKKIPMSDALKNRE